MVRTWCALCILTSKCASHHNGVHFFDISTAKRGPDLVCFVHFDFDMCFAPQRHALFRHRKFQKWSENGVFCTCSLRNVLRATTAYTFRHLNFQKWSEREVFLAFSLANALRATKACTFSTSQLKVNEAELVMKVLGLMGSNTASRTIYLDGESGD